MATTLNQQISILQWNCNGVNSRIAELKNYIHYNSPSIICLQETKLTDKKQFKLINYSIVRKDRPSSKNGGGTLIAIKNDIPFVQIPTPVNYEATAISVLTNNQNSQRNNQ